MTKWPQDSGKGVSLSVDKYKSKAITKTVMFLMTHQVVKEPCSTLMIQSMKGTGFKESSTAKVS